MWSVKLPTSCLDEWCTSDYKCAIITNSQETWGLRVRVRFLPRALIKLTESSVSEQLYKNSVLLMNHRSGRSQIWQVQLLSCKLFEKSPVEIVQIRSVRLLAVFEWGKERKSKERYSASSKWICLLVNFTLFDINSFHWADFPLLSSWNGKQLKGAYSNYYLLRRVTHDAPSLFFFLNFTFYLFVCIESLTSQQSQPSFLSLCSFVS